MRLTALLFAALRRAPHLYHLIIGKQTMHNLGVKLDFQEKTITIDEILLPMRNITNLQLKLRLPGHSEKIPVLLKSQLAPVVPPSHC
jgi:hypothetical protein